MQEVPWEKKKLTNRRRWDIAWLLSDFDYQYQPHLSSFKETHGDVEGTRESQADGISLVTTFILIQIQIEANVIMMRVYTPIILMPLQMTSEVEKNLTNSDGSANVTKSNDDGLDAFLKRIEDTLGSINESTSETCMVL